MGKKSGIIPWHLPSYLSRNRGGGGGGWFLSACKYPRTTSFAARRGGDARDLEGAATLDDVNRFLCENFSSLYDGSVEDDKGNGELVEDRYSGGRHTTPAKTDDDDDDDKPDRRGGPCEILLVSSSQRFFASSLAKSGSMRLVSDDDATATTTGPPGSDDYARVSTTKTMSASVSSASASSSSPDCHRETAATDIPDDGVAVVTFSKDPQDDFRLSMEEMLDAHLTSQEQHQDHHQPPLVVDWDFMQDLLLCYLHLNDPTVHGHILQAFADLVAELRTRNDVVLCDESPKDAAERFHDDEEQTDPYRGTDQDGGPASPVHAGAIFSYSR